MPRPPGFRLGMLVGGVVAEDDRNDLADRCLCLDGGEETDGLLMTLHAAPDRVVEQRRPITAALPHK
jgi:hypothetical protein